jgi:hypothetical protein
MITITDYTNERPASLNPPTSLEKDIKTFSKTFRAAIIRSEVRGSELHIWMDPKVCECDLREDMPVFIWVMRLLLDAWSSEMHQVTQIIGHVRVTGENDHFAKRVVDPLNYVGKTDGGYHTGNCHSVVDIRGLLTWVAEQD